MKRAYRQNQGEPILFLSMVRRKRVPCLIHHVFSKATPPLTVIGYTAVDITSRPDTVSSQSATTWPGQNIFGLGGVARNIAESAHRILTATNNNTVRLISPIGEDALGLFIRTGLSRLGMLTDGLITSSGRTSSVTLQLDSTGDLITGVADIDEDQLGPDQIQHVKSTTGDDTRVVAFDGNISRSTMQAILGEPLNVTIFEPTSIVKSIKIIDVEASPDIMTPNEAELLAMHRHAIEKGSQRVVSPSAEEKARADELQTSLEVVRAAEEIVKVKKAVLLIKGGSRGVLLARIQPGQSIVTLERYPALHVDASTVKNTTGCGDTFAGAVAACVHVKLHHRNPNTKPRQWSNDDWAAIIQVAQKAAILTLQSAEATSSQLDTLSDQVQSIPSIDV